VAKKQNNQNIKPKDIEKLLAEQAKVILSAMDVRMGKSDKKFDEKLSLTKIEILDAVDQKLVKMETRINKKLDKLVTTLDKFLKRPPIGKTKWKSSS